MKIHRQTFKRKLRLKEIDNILEYYQELKRRVNNPEYIKEICSMEKLLNKEKEMLLKKI